MYFKNNQCFDCTIKEETLIRSDKQKWESYSSKKMIQNAKGWFKDADKEVETLKSSLNEVIWENADGQFGEIDRTNWLNKIDTDYKKVKKQVIDHLKVKKNKLFPL